MANIRVPGYDEQGNELDRIVDNANVIALVAKARAAITANNTRIAANTTFLQHAAIPAGTLTTAQLSGIARQTGDQVDALTNQVNAALKELNAVFRLFLGSVDDVSDT